LFSSAAVAVEHSAALVGFQRKAANNCEVEVLQDNGEMAKIILRDSNTAIHCDTARGFARAKEAEGR